MNFIDYIIFVFLLIGFILGFKDGLVRKVIGDYTNKDIDTNKIKQKLIELYLKLEMPSTDLIIEKKTVENWTVFSYINWLNNKGVSSCNKNIFY